MGKDRLHLVHNDLIACERCPGLRNYCVRAAREKRRAYRDQDYWGRPVPGFGDSKARRLIVGLAPAAHGGNRTGRVFTGDRSGDFLFAALHRAGFANQPESLHREDGLKLTDAYITAVLHCAPPGNKPERADLDRCRDYLIRELRLLKSVMAVLALGRIAFDEYLATVIGLGWMEDRRGIRFRHGGRYRPDRSGPTLFASYHPSQQNTQTGRLTAAMLDQVLQAIRRETGR